MSRPRKPKDKEQFCWGWKKGRKAVRAMGTP